MSGSQVLTVLVEHSTPEGRNDTHIAPLLPEGGTRDLIGFEIKVGAPLTGAVGAMCVPFLET